MNINILLAEDHELTRQGIAYGLNKYENLNIIAEAENGQQAIELAEQYKPDLIIMDIVMPIINGIEASKIIKSKLPDTKILMLTSHNEKEKVLTAFNAGANAYCMKNIKIERLALIIEMVNEGAVWLDPHIASYVLEINALNIKENKSESLVSQQKYNDFNLTQREKEILKLVAEGLTNKDIAEQLTLSLYTVKNHVSNLIQKLAVDDRTQAAILALNERII
ncbi:MAG: response regulator transcription factor [bacterium]